MKSYENPTVRRRNRLETRLFGPDSRVSTLNSAERLNSTVFGHGLGHGALRSSCCSEVSGTGRHEGQHGGDHPGKHHALHIASISKKRRRGADIRQEAGHVGSNDASQRCAEVVGGF